MAEPSPKRRRTSAEPPDVSTTGDFRPRNALRRTPPRRASWLSPTKASLARFNPEILSRRASAASAAAEPAAGPADLPGGRGQRALSHAVGESQQQPDRADETNAPAQGGEGERRHSIGGRLLPSRDVLQAAAADQLAQGSAQADKRTASAADNNDDLPTHPAASPAARPDLPPREGLFSSPSKRPRRNRSLGQRLSSPFKPRESPLRVEPPAEGTSAGAEETSPASRGRVQRSPQVIGAGGAEQRTAPVEPKDVVDPRLEEGERLQKRLRELQEEVKQYEREIERSRNAPDDEDTEDLSTLISLANKANPAPTITKPEAPPLSSLLSAFLPLARPIRPPTPPPDGSEKALPSHEPIELDDPLPYLQLLTSFNYSSKVDVAQDSGHQVHSISMRSPSSLLHLDFDLTADPATQSVSKLDVLSISPWTAHELGAFVTQRAADNDVGGVCWATESYYDLAVKRAKCWARCYREFDRLLNDDTEAKVTKSSTKKTSQRKGVQQDVPAGSNPLEDEAEEVSGIGNDLTTKEQNERPISRPELLRGLGRDHIILRSKEVLFRISWSIQFDWTGEAESTVSADVALPSVWREADDRGSLKKIPATFDRLVAEMGVFESIKAMVGLLYA